MWLLAKIAVTPLAGVWIEMSEDFENAIAGVVTPLAGVWIEITGKVRKLGNAVGHSPCGSVDWNILWNRQYFSANCHSPCGSVDWNSVKRPGILDTIFRHSPCGSVDWNLSRHVKRRDKNRHSPCGSVDWNAKTVTDTGRPPSHSPCGSVDWNISKSYWRFNEQVTPLAGVWIEI